MCELSSQRFKWLLASLILCFSFFIASPAISAPINPQLKEQVMQIIREEPELIIESLQAYQQKQQEKEQEKQRKALQSFAKEISSNPKGVIGNSPTIGLAESKIVLVEFSDFQCPYCAQAQKTLKQFMVKHGDEVEFVYKHFPLTSIHSEAIPAAKAAWAAGQQGKFWEYHDRLFSKQKNLGEKGYVSIARTLKLDLKQFNQDRNSSAADAAIAQDTQLAQKLELTSTPFMMLNDEAFFGAVSLTEMENVLSRVRAEL
jgi:protein-disulfide isomerase